MEIYMYAGQVGTVCTLDGVAVPSDYVWKWNVARLKDTKYGFVSIIQLYYQLFFQKTNPNANEFLFSKPIPIQNVFS